ncbi:hypothetical protein OIDMADRAFT_36813 [Oidiodendron maius Zn]|uniref:Pyruvate decarboxylase n=1 Tax=Oidiodendron maius (strain Zn) TaxID=913774 RepID=A0A0C3DYU1_OIDMZ|nr:hypothetical protein OIDMADRAFT_36813 [Oidiodendron maius Zn]
MAQLKIGQYLFTRIKQLGVQTVFGVPGDYELVILDMVPDVGLTWRGNPNELIAGYAADGYARVNGVGAFVTTFGPGELSAYCAVAGQFAEYVPVIHIVGYPSTVAMKNKTIMHHSLGNGEFGMYHEMTKHITVATTVLDDVNTAASEIDRVLNVYIGVPVDMGPKLIPSDTLQTRLITSLPLNDDAAESQAVSKIISLLKSRKDPVIVVDGSAVRNNVIEESTALIELLNIPYFITAMSKGGISERINGKFGGVYGGGASVEEVRLAVEKSELVLFIGGCLSFYRGEFTEDLKPENLIDFQRFFVNIAGEKYNVSLKYSMGPYFKAGDFVIAETGTSSYGIPASPLTHTDGVRMYNQTIFGSIGYATGAALGSFVAGKEDGSIKRAILVTGEGSLQLTVQTFSDLLRHGLNSTIFILNNDGYTVERLIHGMEASYNKVPDWAYSKLCDAFGPSFPSRYYRVATGNELVKLLNDPTFNAADCTQVVELFLDKHDAPLSVKLATAAVEEFNKRNT